MVSVTISVSRSLPDLISVNNELISADELVASANTPDTSVTCSHTYHNYIHISYRDTDKHTETLTHIDRHTVLTAIMNAFST